MPNKISAKLLEQIIEAALLVSGKPVSVTDIRNYFGEDDLIPPSTEIRQTFQKLVRRYKARGIELKEVGTGFRFQVAKAAAPYVIKQWEERPPRYSRALLETLSLIAYRQPITRGDIEDIRGVAVSSNIVRTLLEREWVRVVGHKDVPGRPALYATTSKFLDYFNLKSLTELPELSEVRDLEEINPELDFGDEFQLSSSDAEDLDSEFDGESADLIPDAEEPSEQAIESISEEDKERIRLAKEEANKEAQFKLEMAAREELQDIDRYNSAIEKMIRTPEAQVMPGEAVASDDVFEKPGWLVTAADSEKTDAAFKAGGTEVEGADVEGAEAKENEVKDPKRSRFAAWADQLETATEEIEQKALLVEQQANELPVENQEAVLGVSEAGEGASVLEGGLTDSEGLGLGITNELSDDSVVTSGDDEASSLPDESMSDEDFQQFIQKKLAEQAALLESRSPEEDDES